jgi:hypothetical protein
VKKPYFKPFSGHKAKTPTLKKLYQSWSTYLEAPPGLEPGMKVLQTSALPLGYGAI